MSQSNMSVSQGLRLPRWDLWWHQVGCPAQRLCFLKCFCAAERSQEHLQCVERSAGVSPTEWMRAVQRLFEKHGNWLSHGVFLGFFKCSEVRGAEELLNYLGHWADVLWRRDCIYNVLQVHQRCTTQRNMQEGTLRVFLCTSPRGTQNRGRNCGRDFLMSWRDLVVMSRAGVPPVFPQHHLNIEPWLVGENPPNFPGRKSARGHFL